MDLLKLPTDSLYKFLAIAGLAMIVLGIYYPMSRKDELVDKRISYELKIEQAWGEVRTRIFDAIREDDYLLRQWWHEGSTPDAFQIAIGEHMKTLSDLLSILQRTSSTPTSNPVGSQTVRLPLHNDFDPDWEADQRRLQAFTDQEKLWEHICAVMIVVGVLMSASGFFLWYTRVQRPQDQLLKREVSAINRPAHERKS